uniref:Uncharacterized protein n=1 Tax=Anguilla anguilla TaxID=7936 RepID=A0A0E9VEU1_ANGAN
MDLEEWGKRLQTEGFCLIRVPFHY